MSDCPYEQFDHDADVGLRVRGADLAQLLRHATRGMIELMVDPEDLQAREERKVEVQGDDDEILLVGWLSEVLYAFEVDHFLTAEADVREMKAGCAAGVLRGETFDPDRHEVRSVIKAVTYHALEIRQTDEGLEVSIVFDV